MLGAKLSIKLLISTAMFYIQNGYSFVTLNLLCVSILAFCKLQRFTSSTLNSNFLVGPNCKAHHLDNPAI